METLQKTATGHKTSEDHGEPSPRGYIYLTAPVSMVQGTSQERQEKRVEGPGYQEVLCEKVCPRNHRINKSRKMAISVDILLCKWENVEGSHQ